MSGKLFVITAPSGAGKTSLIDAVMREDPSLKISVSYTTRKPRPGEKDGVDYHFIDPATFEKMKSRGEFLESAEVHGNHYGTGKQVILDAVKRGDDLILEIDWQGAQQVRKLGLSLGTVLQFWNKLFGFFDRVTFLLRFEHRLFH